MDRCVWVAATLVLGRHWTGPWGFSAEARVAALGLLSPGCLDLLPTCAHLSASIVVLAGWERPCTAFGALCSPLSGPWGEAS